MLYRIPYRRLPVTELVRRARRIARTSQNEMAARAGVAQSTIARIESGAMTPSLGVLSRVLAAADLYLVVTDIKGHIIEPMRAIEGVHDAAGRRFPAHLDVIMDPKKGEWWGDRYGLMRPPETFRLDPEMRQAQRQYVKWESRPYRYRGQPRPPHPEWLRKLAEYRRDEKARRER